MNQSLIQKMTKGILFELFKAIHHRGKKMDNSLMSQFEKEI
jgi:hypothetical protein